MQVILTEKESEDIFYNSLCNGLSVISNWGFDISYSDKHYKEAKFHLIEEKGGLCYEDILMQLLKMGNSIEFIDIEQGTDSKTLTLKMIHENVSKAPIHNISNIINEYDDAEDADVILQFVIFGEVVYV